MESRVEPESAVAPAPERKVRTVVLHAPGRGGYEIQDDGSWKRLDTATEARCRAEYDARREARRAEDAAAKARQVERMRSTMDEDIDALRSAVAEMGGDPR